MSPDSPNIHDVLAYEIKKEIADRYFGFRKLIEDDKLDFVEKTRQYSFILEKRISFDLIRIYIVLKDEPLIHRFLALTGLPADLFYDPYLSQSGTIRQRVFSGVRIHGLTHAGRFKNLVFDCYERLEVHVTEYRSRFAELKRYREEINEEIEIFYRKNDLGSIMGFLRTLGDPNKTGSMEGGMEMGLGQSMEAKMRIEPQLPPEHYLPVIQSLPPLASIKGELKSIIRAAYEEHGTELIHLLSRQQGGKAAR
ncbi:MAG: hypothetical protein A2512_08425 [Deltaproteobacteria bacterium RIFOXYD12_FULL_56_24]|nr:MAG: hypothetical protein A2512_08425 [Deltaproteobacteria bacterium RIFOXYD12_FULL_56_24]